MITLHDSPNSDLDIVDAMADMSENFNLYDYVSIRQKNEMEWIGQIVYPNRNISTLGGRTDPVILHGLELMQKHDNVRAVESVQIYGIQLRGYYADGAMQTFRTRPLPGSVATKLSSDITLQILNFPAHDKDAANVIGELKAADNVPITVRSSVFNHHIMVAGGTGSGKSNIAANLVAQAVKMQKCVIIHDAKPDYKKIKKPNSDPKVSEAWKSAKAYGLTPHAAADVVRVGFHGKCDPSKVDNVLTLEVTDFPKDVLAGIFFPRKGEELQYENFLDALNRQEWKYTLDKIAQAIEQNKDLHKENKMSILRKIRTRRAKMPWLVDKAPSAQQDLMSSSVNRAGGMSHRHGDQITSLFGEGKIIVVDYSQMDDEDYALVLSFFLQACQQFRKDNKNRLGVVQLIDEAHRIFDNQSSHSGSMASNFARTMREGRTLDHSIILSLQSASLIPGNVRTNLNSRFVMRQNSKYDADHATEIMGKTHSASSMRLGTGQALVSMHESQEVVLAQMFPSPYELMRTDNTGNPA